MRRHTITLGATTTVGGKVISASSSGSINGVTIALEGDLIYCRDVSHRERSCASSRESLRHGAGERWR